MRITFQSVDKNIQGHHPPPRASRASLTYKKNVIPDCNDLKGKNHNKCRRGRDVLSCHNYMDKNQHIQRKCTCGPSNTTIGLPNFGINGCGPRELGRTDSSANQFLHKDTVKCCDQHDICMSRLVDSGPCARRFNTCLKKVQDFSMLGMFKRNMMGWMVRTSSYTFLPPIQKFRCYRIDKPKLNTLQLKYQQELFNLQRGKKNVAR